MASSFIFGDTIKRTCYMNSTKTVYCFLLSAFSVIFSGVNAQVPVTYNSADIYMQLKKLNMLGSVLYIAAHPDDENNGFLPWLAKEKLYRTGYLSLTRGDGGQNLIGSEQGIELGLIRTQELLAARRIDGAEQYFSSAYEFGFSKSAAEALTIWDKEQVLGDIVYVIRRFQPDILITRFPGDARAGHGHHAASSILANEAFTAAADPKRFPEQFKLGVGPWQAKRILWNGFNFGGNNTTTGMPLRLDAGAYDPLIGKSSGDLGGEARSMHKSQGEGRPRRKGEIIENFITTGGDSARNDIMEGILTSWERLTGGEEVGGRINRVIKQFNFEHPEHSVDSLIEIYKNITRLPNKSVWHQQKLEEVKKLIIHCSAIFAEATTREEFILQNDTATVTCFVNKRSNIEAELKSIKLYWSDKTVSQPLKTNQNYTYDMKEPVMEPPIGSATQPYWLQLPQTPGVFKISNPLLVGKAWNDALINARFNFEIRGFNFFVDRPVQYKYVDPVKGEVYQPFVIVPHLSISMNPHVPLLNVKTETGKKSIDSITITYKANFTRQQVPTTAYILQDTVKPVFVKQLRDYEKGKSYNIKVPLHPFYNQYKGDYLEAAMRINLDGKDYVFSQYFKSIEYDHIPNIHISFKDRIKFVKEEIITTGKKVGYINGAGDMIPEALKEMGYEVKILSEQDITEASLRQYDAVVVGIRAHNIYEYLSDKNDVLNNYVKNGGNLIAQYIKSNTIGAKRLKLGPYPFTISTASRITEEDAPVSILLPQHPVLNYPNKITGKDFEGWIQERSTYQVDKADSNFVMPLSMHDTGEKESNGSLAIAKYGKGNFAYVSLVLFRQLPAGIPGAYRLLANLIALPKNSGVKNSAKKK
jgi:LmbE family N-acetylglucosaminyl deacetylase